MNSISTYESVAKSIGSLRLLTGPEVMALLNDDDFQRGWDILYQSCPWGTVFQSRDFVTTWYQLYLNSYLPVVVFSEYKSNLTGILTLARSKDGRIIGAGSNQAEYQVWLAGDAYNNNFIKEALAKLRKHFPKDVIQLKYIPSSTPIDWLIMDPLWKDQCMVKAFKQPLLVVDEESISRELRKKNRREKLNRLKRLGELKFKRITDQGEFASILKALATQFDFRKGATVNLTPFQDDPYKMDFILALFEKKLLHVTVLLLNDEIIASNVGVSSKKWVHLQGINTHSPLYAKHSPGILHFLMLAKLLIDENFSVFDLTPGGDSYKEVLANKHVEAYQLTISNSYSRYIRNVRFELTSYIKLRLAKAGIEPSILKNIKKNIWIFCKRLNLLRSQELKSLATGLINKGTSKRIKFYTINAKTPPNFQISPLNLHEYSLTDFLSYEVKGSFQTRWEFLEEAMKRFEAGERSYTWSLEGRLLGCAWLGKGGAGGVVPAGAPVLQGFYYHPAGQGELAGFLAAVVRDVAGTQEDGPLYAAAGDPATCRALEAIGFKMLNFNK